ncbi:MAG: TRAP transporter small permease subunit [Deltaproteobacteria bacterium]|nr:TRAP transporter small permease subunit [Deltaproteobacteria bacterium]
MEHSTVIQKIEYTNEWIGKIVCFLAAPLCLLIAFEVIRRAVGSPTIWSYEISLMLFGSHFMLLAAYGLKHKAHASIDIISRRFSEKTQCILSLISYIVLFFPMWTFFFIFGLGFAYDAWVCMETSWTMWGQPLYIVKTIIPVTAFLLILQGVAEVIKLADSIWRG